MKALAAEVRALTAGRGITPLERPAAVRPTLVQLGQALAFDKILSGNQDISCMTCHLPTLGDRRRPSLSIGQGGTGLGPTACIRTGRFIPRNAPPCSISPPWSRSSGTGGSSSDAAGHLPHPGRRAVTPAMKRVFEFGPLSALPLFPVLSREEMRAGDGNELAPID